MFKLFNQKTYVNNVPNCQNCKNTIIENSKSVCSKAKFKILDSKKRILNKKLVDTDPKRNGIKRILPINSCFLFLRLLSKYPPKKLLVIIIIVEIIENKKVLLRDDW